MAEPLTILGHIAKFWDKEKADGKGTFTIVKLEGSDVAYFDFSGKVNAEHVQEGDYVEITYTSNGNTKLLGIRMKTPDKQTELAQEAPEQKPEVKPEAPREDPTAWRIARTSALKILAENSTSDELVIMRNAGTLFKAADELAAYIVTGKHPEAEKPKKSEK